MPRLHLKPGREKSLRQHHPWIFSGAIARVEGEPSSGATVEVLDAQGAFLAWAAFSPQSQIRARVWSFEAKERIDAAFFARRIAAAIAARAPWLAGSDAARLIHGEADGLPGLVVDRYGEVLVIQVLAAGIEAWREALVAALLRHTGATVVYERSDAEVRTLEGLSERCGALHGELPEVVEISEDGIRYRVDVAAGQKTGFYLDQRVSRQRVRALAQGREVLNCFCYSGGFSLAALAGGATSVLSLDSSAAALELARDNLRRNGFAAAQAEWRDADVFSELRRLRDQARSFDLIVLDPPKFAPTAQHAARAARAYKDINLTALKLLRPGGLLATFSCSGGIDAMLFQRIVAGAALDARVEARLIGHFEASPDHATALCFPEGTYLKGLLLQKG
jgi:23S rRNA (cytosine1962-C5)-methyltransferase